MAELKDFFKSDKEKERKNGNKVTVPEVFLTDVEVEILGKKEKRKLNFFLKTPNLFVYRDLLRKEFVDAEEVEFMVTVANERKQKVTGFFQRVPIFDLLFFQNKESWDEQVKKFKSELKKGSFFALSRTYQGIFSTGTSEMGNLFKVLKQVSELVPVVYFPFVSWKRVIEMGFVNFNSSEEHEKIVGAIPEGIEEPNLVLVLDDKSEAKLTEAFKCKMNEYVETVEKALSDVLKNKTHVLAVLETTTEGQPLWDFYFLKKEDFQKVSSELEKKVKEREKLLEKVTSQEGIFTDLVQSLKSKYPQPFLYSGWLITIVNATLFEPLENVFNFVYRKCFSIIFSASIFYVKLKDEVTKKKFAFVYDKRTLQDLSSLYFEDVKAKRQAIVEQFESYKNVLDSILQFF